MSSSSSLQSQIDQIQLHMQELQAAIGRMPEQVAALLLASQSLPVNTLPSLAPTPGYRLNDPGSSEETYSFLLQDEAPSASHRSMGHEIPAEAQVQRLTAQLTAAYNRIAALEEQLLAQRMHY